LHKIYGIPDIPDVDIQVEEYHLKEEAGIVGWRNKRSSEKKMSIAIYDILSENRYPEDKTNEIIMQIIDLAKCDL
jgi:hypothetical protein